MKGTLLFLVIVCMWSSVYARCSTRGDCAVIGGRLKPCPVDEEPKPIFDNLSPQERHELREQIERRCPHLLYDENGNRLPDNQVMTCCDPVQVFRFSESLNMGEGVLARCPVCWRNFVRQICEMNCSPDQARFVNVTTNVSPDNITYVEEINYRLHHDFMINSHKSCSEVMVPQSGMPAINLMCGNAPVCDADAWFGYTGDATNNPFVDVQVNFIITHTLEDSMNIYAPLCNETIGDDIPCSCLDCTANCPTSEIEVPSMCTVLSVNCISFSVGITFFVISVIVFIILALLEVRRQRQSSGDTKNNEEKDNTNKLTKFFQNVFEKIGEFSASNPIIMIMLTTWVVFAMTFGIINIKLTANPLELWSDPDSVSRHELNYFNSRFGPFYRAAQVYLTMKGLEPFQVGNVTYGPAFRVEAIQELIKLEDAILNIGRDDGTVKLENVCYAPLRQPGAEQKLEDCVSMSVSAYIPNRIINNNTYLNNVQNCLNNYLSPSCLQPWGGGADPELSFGGFEDDNFLAADSLIINYPITNHLLEADLEPVLDWELKFLKLMEDYERNWKADFVDVAYGAERSIEDEIQRVSEAEIVPIAISYLLMFIYVIFALGHIRRCSTFLLDSKISVAIGSILVVLAALYCAMGILGFVQVTISLLAINVIPFFVLSIGIDNVFLMVNSIHRIQSNLDKYSDYKEGMSFDKKRRFIFGKMMQSEGPSMFVSSITQVTCFAVGTIANFPAVRVFALFATISLAFLFVFQITTVVAILSLDFKRCAQNRFDLFCCVQKKVLNDEEPLHSEIAHEGVTQKLMEPYAKFLLNWRVKIIVAIVFLAFMSICTILIPSIEVGLDQNLAVPPDSYVYKYLDAVNDILRLGPPVFFVLKSGLNFTNPEHQNVVCGGQLCNDDSLTMQIFLAVQQKEITYLGRISNSWIDDFFDWSSLPGTCCKYNTTDGGFCSSMSSEPECQFCTIPQGEFANGLRPGTEAFQYYIPFFLQDTPTETCNKGGLASYYSNVNYVLDSEGRATVHDSNFMAYHTNLKTSYDYITAVKYGYEVSKNITAAIHRHTGLDVEVFPYSVFYVYYAQYLTAWGDTFSSLAYCVLGALLINIVVTGFNFTITLATIFTVIMVVIDMMGIMYMWNIQMNAVSCINLIVSIGITVEFCSHLAYAYATSSRPPDERVADAIKKVGATIITGITFTNIPIIVLAFSYTEIIEIFFFRMLFSLVILGCLHGMVFFPVLLSYLNNFKYKI
ncbi:NPC intracellular cholesterol transporter 1 homolog 1b-like [Zerene cesonia]|uniref:NPC intracellular cholesterol transporter 1 homolog 1b-like n=1 Tax=Zerene cesonia TaxID=33412 RepID=UPI0018E55531|nr:NPC intracellular cholesterol transporter 1 homolog 1b-like [Zerene cesonia]